MCQNANLFQEMLQKRPKKSHRIILGPYPISICAIEYFCSSRTDKNCVQGYTFVSDSALNINERIRLCPSHRCVLKTINYLVCIILLNRLFLESWRTHHYCFILYIFIIKLSLKWAHMNQSGEIKGLSELFKLKSYRFVHTGS